MCEHAIYRRARISAYGYPQPAARQIMRHAVKSRVRIPSGGHSQHRALPPTSGKRSHAIFKQLFAHAASRVRQRSAEFEATAARLAMASAHWQRHTAGSQMANSAVDLRQVRDTLGHKSISTTSG